MSQTKSTIWASSLACTHPQGPLPALNMRRVWVTRNRTLKHSLIGALVCSSPLSGCTNVELKIGADYLKYDNCYNEGQEGNGILTYNRYKAMSDALNATGRPILYSMCNWGQDHPWDWAQTIANSWRMSGDVYDSFDRPDARCPCDTYECSLPGFHCSVMNILNKAAPVLNKAQPGAWNDLDMLEVGNSGMTDDEYITHFSMWYVVEKFRQPSFHKLSTA